MKRDKVGKDKDKDIGQSIGRGIGRGVGKDSFHNPKAPMIQQQSRVRVVRAGCESGCVNAIL